jgi:hypothetical protein
MRWTVLMTGVRHFRDSATFIRLVSMGLLSVVMTTL